MGKVTNSTVKPYYRELRDREEDACRMVLKSFNEFVAPGYNEEGYREFERYVNPEALRGRLEQGNFVFVALDEDSIIGLIEIRSNNHVALLFVDKKWHHRGVATKLLELGIERCRQNDKDLRVIEVNSSPYAVSIYEKMGFVKTGEERVENGIRYTPMELRIG